MKKNNDKVDNFIDMSFRSDTIKNPLKIIKNSIIKIKKNIALKNASHFWCPKNSNGIF